MSSQPSAGVGAASPLRSVVFFVAALVVLDYLLPRGSGWLWLGGLLALVVGVGMVVGGGNRWVSDVQSVLLISMLSLAVGIVGVEVIFRLFLLRPGVPSTDEAFSDHIAAHWPEPVDRERVPGETRIIGLADSFGRAGEEDNFFYVMSRQLSAGEHPNEIVNLSEWGLELRDELDLLRRFGHRFTPDLVVHSFFVGNDFDLPSEDLSFFGTVPMRYSAGMRPIRPRWFLHRRWLENCWRARQDRKLAADEGFSDRNFLAIERQRLSKWSNRDYLELVWPDVTELLDEIRAEASIAGADYAMVIHPDQYQVDQDLRDKLAADAGIDEGEVELDLPQSYLRRYCESEGVACLDLLSFLQSVPDSKSLYLMNDTHYNLKGNVLVGQEVARFLEAQLEALGDPG